MKQIRFSFKTEPIWILLFAVAPAVVGLLIVLLVVLTMKFRL